MHYDSSEELIIAAASARSNPTLLKNTLIQLAQENDCEINNKASKKDVALLLADKVGYARLQELVHTGVSSQDFQEKFEICHDDVKRMERKGFLKVTGYYQARMYGKYRKVPLYDAFQYFGLTKIEIDEWLIKQRH